MLVRRVRERFNEDLLCIGTSATMASEGSAKDRNAAVAEDRQPVVRGARSKPNNVITETLEPVTDKSRHVRGRPQPEAGHRGGCAGARPNPRRTLEPLPPQLGWSGTSAWRIRMGSLCASRGRLTVIQASRKLADMPVASRSTRAAPTSLSSCLRPTRVATTAAAASLRSASISSSAALGTRIPRWKRRASDT